MTKSAKRKKERNTDFTKPKLKLGKGKQSATNAVDTSFKARSIALPQQSISVSKDASAPTTKRKLTLEDLLAHLKHYNAGIRKDALQGLRELLEEHYDLIEPNLLKLVNASARLISDEDASVRKEFHSFFSWLLPRVPRVRLLLFLGSSHSSHGVPVPVQEHLPPHASTLLLFTASAQTHIFPEIRIDAIRILDLLLEFIPDQVVSGVLDANPGGGQGSHGRKVLDGYLGLLSIGARFSEDEGKRTGSSLGAMGYSTTLITLSSASKARVLRSFSKFLLHATAHETVAQATASHPSNSTIPLWYLSPSFSSLEAFESFTKIMSVHRSSRTYEHSPCIWKPSDDLGDDDDDYAGRFPLAISDNIDTAENLSDLERIAADIDLLVNSDKHEEDLDSFGACLTASLCRTVHPVLVSTFLDCAPSVFSPTQTSPESDELELVLSLMEISRCLYGRLLRDGNATQDQKHAVHEGLETLISYMMVYFPFGENRILAQDMKAETMFQQMNLIYCELFSLHSLSAVDVDETKKLEGVNGRTAKRRKLTHHVSKASKSSLTNQGVRVQEYVIRCLHGSAAPGANGGAYPLGQTLSVQTYVALLPTLWWLLNYPANDENDPFEVLEAIVQHATKIGSGSGVKMAATQFIACLVLLQSERSYRGILRIGRSSPESSQTVFILLVFLRISQRRSWLNDAGILPALCTRLQPFFTTQHAARGELRGPYARLNKPPAEAQSPHTENEGQEFAPLKRLALDVAATLVLGFPSPSAPLNLPPRTNAEGRARKAEGRVGAGSEASAASARGAGSTATAGVPGFSKSEYESREGLRRAVEKAVVGTAEEAYWRGVSGR
ncbi:hypothetical protein EW145_g1260 [Phellinidium pouzarii]|uniref:Pre-rRNA-processing protein n=1 Tax=Phellinidium pouzarii TaxID=167371 RepID=A0A4S4LF71_9AGAM|nr:hypothetical protein EW145_g1260 [Phellinidium pouzarii]